MRVIRRGALTLSPCHLVTVSLALSGFAAPASAHPVPKGAHDRILTVRLTRDAVVVDYRLEVDQWTIVFQDLEAVADKVDLKKLSKPEDFWTAFEQTYAPILADNLIATLDGKPLTFTCVKRTHEITKPDNNLRCDFVFRAAWQPVLGQRVKFAFREGNYELEEGRIQLALTSEPGVGVFEKVEPDEALKARLPIDLKPGDSEKLRTAKATCLVPGTLPPSAPVMAETAAPLEEPAAGEAGGESLLDLLLDTRRGFWVLLLLAGGFGAAHALTPGHGKTLVAAYLVGERGTALHAVVLGLVTTVTHTGAVILLAAGLLFLFPKAVPAQLQVTLGLASGLLVAGMGLWLLLRRLSGGADHVHVGGGHGHSHSHGHSHGHAHALPAPGERVHWWDLIVLGMSGGIVPCWDALAMFGWAIGAQRLWLGLPLLLAFSAGLASVLVVIGLGVVYVKGFATSRLGEGGFIRALPLVSAVLVTVMGLWLCYESLHPRTAPPAGVVSARTD
jgi:nickel/cobalt transporter (NicO) family protein